MEPDVAGLASASPHDPTQPVLALACWQMERARPVPIVGRVVRWGALFRDDGEDLSHRDFFGASARVHGDDRGAAGSPSVRLLIPIGRTVVWDRAVLPQDTTLALWRRATGGRASRR